MSSALRSRPTASIHKNNYEHTRRSSSSSSSSSSPSPPGKKSEPTLSQNEEISRLPSLLDILRLLLTLLILSTTLSYFITSSLTWNYRPPWTRPVRIRAWLRGPLLLTPQQLSLYNGTSYPSLPVLLALNNTIYDVSSSPQIYGPGGSYHIFAGRDATRAFITGCFDTDLTSDVWGVEEMFMPIYEDEEEGYEGVVVASKVKKVRRERDLRLAKKKVEEVVRGWEGLFDGGKGGKYFRVGRVVGGEEGWGERMGLCEKAREGRVRVAREGGSDERGREGVRRAGDVV